MAIIKKYSPFQNLSNYQTFLIDTNPNSRYFRITEFKDTFTGGKNGFLIEGSEHLKETTEVKIEILDVEGNTIYFEPGEGIPEYYEGLSKLVAVHVYDDTPIGIAKITVLGELKSYVDSQGVVRTIPDDWKGVYNVKWEKEFKVNKNLVNEDIVRFYKRPQITITELIKPIFSKTIPSATDVVEVSGVPQNPPLDTNLTNWRAGTNYKLIRATGSWDRDVDENIITISSLNYSPTIIEVLNDTEVLVDVPYSVDGLVKSFVSQSASVTYSDFNNQVIADSALTGSFAKIDMSQLKTFVGDVARVKIFRKSKNTAGDFQFVQESKLESTELLRDVTTQTDNEISYGNFTETNLSTYWETSSNDHPTSIDSSLLSQAVKVDYNNVLGGTQRLITSESFSLSKDVEYTLSFKTLLNGTATTDKYIKAYFSGSYTNNLGNPASFTQSFMTVSGSAIYNTRQNVSQNILAERDIDAKLVLEFKGDDWYASSISLKNAQETSFSPDEFILIQDIPRKLAAETFDFRFEFYDINNNYIPVDVTATATFTGGNDFPSSGKILTFESDRNAFRFSTGSIANPYNQTIQFKTTTQNLTGSILFESQAFDVDGNYLSPSNYSQYPGLLTNITTAGALLTLNNFTGSYSGVGTPPYVGSIVYTASLETLQEFETVYRLEDGDNAPALIVTSNANQFIYEPSKLIPKPSGQAITVRAQRKNLASLITPIEVNSGSNLPPLTYVSTTNGVDTYTISATEFSQSFAANNFDEVTYSFTGSDVFGNNQTDEITLSKVVNFDAVSFVLSNESTSFPANSIGVVTGGFSASSGSVRMFIGSNEIPFDDSLSKNTFEITNLQGTNCTPNGGQGSDPTTNEYGITAMSADEAALAVTVTYKAGDNSTTQSFDKLVTYNKAKKAQPSITFSVTPQAQTVSAKSTGGLIGTITDVQVLGFEGNTTLTYNQGTLSPGQYKITDVTGVTASDTTPSTSTIDITTFSGDDVTGTATIEYRDSEGTSGTSSIKFSLSKAKKAAPSVLTKISPSTQTINSSSAGFETPQNVEVIVLEGGVEYTYDDSLSSGGDSNAQKFRIIDIVSGSQVGTSQFITPTTQSIATYSGTNGNVTMSYVDSEGTYVQNKVARFDVSVSKTGVDGDPAKAVHLKTDKFIILYDEYGNVSGSNIIGLTGSAQGYDTPEYEFRQNDNIIRAFGTINTMEVPTDGGSLPSKDGTAFFEVRTREQGESYTNVDDEVEVYGVGKGRNYLIFLTNETHNFPADEFGNPKPGALEAGSTEVRFYKMVNDVLTKFTYDGTAPYGANTYRTGSIDPGDYENITASGSSVGDDFKLTPTSVSSNLGGFEIHLIDNSDSTNAEFDRQFTFSINEDGIKNKDLEIKISDGGNFIKPESGSVWSPSVLQIEGVKQNITGSVNWTAGFDLYDQATGGSTTTTGDIVYARYSDFESSFNSGTVNFPITASVTNSENSFVYTDSDSIKVLQNGSSAITVDVSNPVEDVSSTNGGFVDDYTDTGTDIQVFQGADLLTFTTGTAGNGEYTVSTSISPASGIQLGTISGNGTTTFTISDHDDIDQDEDKVTITYSISGKRFDGSSFTTSAKQKIFKVKDGPAGISAFSIELVPPSQEVIIDIQDNITTPDTFAVQVFDTSGNYSYDAALSTGATFYIDTLAQSNTGTTPTNSSGTITPGTPSNANGSNVTFNVYVKGRDGNTSSAISKTHKINVVADGSTGPGIVFTGEWDTDRIYQYDLSNGRRDAVLYDGVYYATLQQAGTSIGTPDTESTYWESLGTDSFFVAAEIGIFKQSYVQNTLNIGTTSRTVSAANITLHGADQYPYFSLGQSADTGSQGYAVGSGIFIGRDTDGDYKASFESAGSNYLKWDGGKLLIQGDIDATSISADSGSIGGWTLATSYLDGDSIRLEKGGNITVGSSNNVVRLSSTDSTYRIWAGNATAANANFKVTTGGALTATSADITGVINATSGNFTGFVTAGTSPQMKFGVGVATGKNGIHIDANDYWYSDGNFSFGNGGITWNSSTSTLNIAGSVNIGSTSASTIEDKANNALISGSAAKDINDNTTTISGGKITTDSLSANQISSLNFTGKTANFDQGTIGGFLIGSHKLSTTGFEIGDSTQALAISSSNFAVDHDGNVTAQGVNVSGTVSGSIIQGGQLQGTSGDFSGSVTAGSGLIGGWTIANSQIYTSALSLNATRPALEVYNNSNLLVDINSSTSLSSLGAGSPITDTTSPTYTDSDSQSGTTSTYTSRTVTVAAPTSYINNTGIFSNVSSTFSSGDILTFSHTGNQRSALLIANLSTEIRNNSSGTSTLTMPTTINVYTKVELKASLAGPVLATLQDTHTFTNTSSTNSGGGATINTYTPTLDNSAKSTTFTYGGETNLRLYTQTTCTFTFSVYQSNGSSTFDVTLNIGEPEYACSLTKEVSKTEIAAGGLQVVRDQSNYVIMDRANVNVAMVRVGGDITATGNITANASDIRLKDNILKIENPLEKINKLNGIYFNWNSTANQIAGFDTDITNVGLIAQEVEEVLPEATTLSPLNKDDSTSYKTIWYDKLVPLLIEGIKELYEKVNNLEEENKRLKDGN